MTQLNVLNSSRAAPGLASLRVADSGVHNAQTALVYIADVDHHAQQRLASWLIAAGIESQTYSDLNAMLENLDAARAGCVVIDADCLARSGLELSGIALSARCPIVVTAHRADVATAVRALKSGAIDFVEKPLGKQDIVAVISAAIEADRFQRAATSRLAAVRERFATLSRRERQVMALVTAGRLNKQVGGDLGLSEITVKAHRGAAMRKMGARSLADLVRMADAIGEELCAA
jgi:FixJ family two-component response regulator